MILRIPHDLVLVWRSPTALQIGAPDPLVIIDDVTTGIDWLVARLRRGMTERAAISAAVRHGSTRREAHAALDALRPVLVEVDEAGDRVARPHAPAVALRASADRHDAALEAMTQWASSRGIPARRLAPDALPRAGEVLLEVADFVVPPRRAQPLMAADVEHVAMLLGDHDMTVTPRITPGETACLRCEDLARTDSDPSWPIVATQLVDTPSPPLDERLLAVAALTALRAATATGPTVAHRIDRTTGEVTTRRWRMHPSCGCRAVPEIEMAGARDLDHRPTRSSLEAGDGRASRRHR